jgi:hypothetical protein
LLDRLFLDRTFGSNMATKSPSSSSGASRPTLTDAQRQLRLAIDECRVLLRRNEELLRQSQQDN